MAELPEKVHLTSHPFFLRICGHSVYEDEEQRTWLHLVMETGGDLQVRLSQEDIPSGHIAPSTSPLNSSTVPSWWTLQFGIRYLDPMCRFWRIVHHVKGNGLEEMILKLINDYKYT